MKQSPINKKQAYDDICHTSLLVRVRIQCSSHLVGTMNKIIFLWVMLILFEGILGKDQEQEVLINRFNPSLLGPLINDIHTGFLANEWFPMSYEEIFQFFQKSEVCEVLHVRKEFCGTPPPIDSLKECAIHQGGKSQHSKLCPTNTVFYRHHNTTIKSKKAIDVISLMKLHESNILFFVGDSLTGQHIMDTVCALMRNGLQITTMDTYFTHFVHDPANISQTMESMKENVKTMSLHDAFFALNFLRLDKGSPADVANLFHKIEHQIMNTTLFPSINKSNNNKRPVFIVNSGVHYNYHPFIDSNGRKDEWGIATYQLHLRSYLETWIRLVKTYNYVVLFRETSAQHFPTVDGIYDVRLHRSDPSFSMTVPSKSEPEHEVPSVFNISSSLYDDEKDQTIVFQKEDICMPLTSEEQLKINNWRNEVLYQILNELDPQQEYIQVIKFHRLSAARHDLRVKNDCTHFCNAPMVWLPLWQQIYDILKSKFSSPQ
jgi:hypothetical protein